MAESKQIQPEKKKENEPLTEGGKKHVRMNLDSKTVQVEVVTGERLLDTKGRIRIELELTENTNILIFNGSSLLSDDTCLYDTENIEISTLTIKIGPDIIKKEDELAGAENTKRFSTSEETPIEGNEILQEIKIHIEKSLKIDDENIQLFLSTLESEALPHALRIIEQNIAPKSFAGLKKLCETGPLKELICQLPSPLKTSQVQFIVQLMKKEIERHQKFAQLASFAEVFTEDLQKNGSEGFLREESVIPILDRLEIAFLFFSSEEITQELVTSEAGTNSKTSLLIELEELLASHSQVVGEQELRPMLKYFSDNLDLQEFINKIKIEIAPKKFPEVKSRIENDSRITKIITTLKIAPNLGNLQQERSLQAQILERKLRIGKGFIDYCGIFLPNEEAEQILRNLCHSLNLEGAIREIEQHIAPSKFLEIKKRILADENIQKVSRELEQIQLNPSGDKEIQDQINKLKNKIWESLSSYLPNDPEMISIVKQQVLEDLDLEVAVAYLQENLVPRVFKSFKESLDSNTEIHDLIDKARTLKKNSTNLNELEQIQLNPSGDKEIQDQINKLKNKIWESLSSYLPNDPEMISIVKQQVLEDLDLEVAVAYLQENLVPRVFKSFKESLDSNTEIHDLIDKTKALKRNYTKLAQIKQLQGQMLTQLNLFKPRLIDEKIWIEFQDDLKNTLCLEQSLSTIEDFIAPKDYKMLIEKTTQDSELIKIIQSLEEIQLDDQNEKVGKQTDKALQLFTDFVIEQITRIQRNLSSEGIKKIKKMISDTFSAKDDIQTILDEVLTFVCETKLGFLADKVQDLKQEVLKSSLITQLNYYLAAKEILKNILQKCQIQDQELLKDVSYRFSETQNLEDATAPLKLKYPDTYDHLLELLYENEDFGRIVFSKFEQAPGSFLKQDYIKKAKFRIQEITKQKNQRMKYPFMISLLEHIHKNGLHIGYNSESYPNEEEKNILKSVLEVLRDDPLRIEIDAIKVREELEKDIQEIVDLKPIPLKELIEQIVEKGLMSALLAEADNNLTIKQINEILSKLVPYIQTKEIYKVTKLYSKDRMTWSAKADLLFSKFIERVSNKEDSETLKEIEVYLKNGVLDPGDVKEIRRILTRIARENRYMEFNDFIKQIFERDYETLKTYKEVCKEMEVYEELDKSNLLKYQLKFSFQFKELENYIDEIILEEFNVGEELYRQQAAKYQAKSIELAKPALLAYKEFIKQNRFLLPVLVELEKAKRAYKMAKNHKILDNINKVMIPKLFGLDKDLCEIWSIRNKSEDFPIKDYEITSTEYALYPVEACRAAKKIASSVKFPNIQLTTFNVVTFRSSQEDQDLMIKSWIENSTKPESFGDLLPIYFNLLKRGEDWRTFVEKVSYQILDKKLSGRLGFFQRKFLFYLLLVSGDKELKARLLQLYGQYNPIPLRYPKWPMEIQSSSQAENLDYEFNDLIYYAIQPSLGILSLGLGDKASLPIGKSGILNKVFKKNFPSSESSPFHVNTIDIDLDSSFRPYRQFCIIDAHGRFPLKELQYFMAICKVVVVHVHAEDLIQDKLRGVFEEFSGIVRSQKHDHHLVILVRDDNLDGGFYEENRNKIQERFPQLEPLFRLPEKIIRMASLKSMVDLNTNEESVLNQKLQTTILGAVQLFKDARTVTKETFRTHLLKNLKNEDQHEIVQVDDAVKLFINEMKKYLNDFFDEKVFPCRNYLWKLRLLQKTLRTAKTDDELNKAKVSYAEFEKKLKDVKPSALIKLFVEILLRENCYLVVMELSRDIKDIVSASVKELNAKRDAMINEMKPKATNKDDPSNTDEAQRLNLLKNQEKLKEIIDEIDHRSLSIEVIWRELMALYTYNKSEVEKLNIDPVQKIKEFLDKGEPFELIDGDNIQFNENVLKDLFSTLKGKMCTVCVLGPQSSGKSTLLNYLFGCQFVSSVGRCTRGIYLSILKINNNPNYEYLMILDTEGLQSVEKNDDEFDRKITLFCLAVSQVILVNVKGDLHLPMKSLLEICTLSLHGLNMAKIAQPTIYFVFNQNPPTKDKTPFMTQIATMMKEIIDANPEARDAAEILCPSENNLHALGFAFQTSKEEKNANRNIWQDWPFMQPQSSFANECAGLSQVIYKTLNDRFLKASDSQNVLTDFKEWSKMANKVWKTIDMFPNLLEFGAIRHMKQDRELGIHGARLLDAKKDRLNGEKVIAEKIRPLFEHIKTKQNPSTSEQIRILSDHYNTIKQEISGELMRIREQEKYDYDLTKKHEKQTIGRIDSYEQEAILLINRDTLQIMLDLDKNQSLQGITDKIGDYLLDPQVSASKEAAELKFEELWRTNIEKGLNTFLNTERHDRVLWTTIHSVYSKETFLPDMGTEKIKGFHSIVNNDPQNRLDKEKELTPLIRSMIDMIKNDFGCQIDDKSDIFLKDISIRYRQPTTYFSLAKMLKQTSSVHYFDIAKMMNNETVCRKWKEAVDKHLLEKYHSKEIYYEKFLSILNVFTPLGYFPLEKAVDDIRDKIFHPPKVWGSSQSEIKRYLEENYCEYSQAKEKPSKEKPSIFEKKNTPSFSRRQDIPESKYWKIDLIEYDVPIEQNDHHFIETFEKIYDDYCVIKNMTPRFEPKSGDYETGLKYCIDPFSGKISLKHALEELRSMILNHTEWVKLLEDIYENIMKEIKVNVDLPSLERANSNNSIQEDEEAYYRDISSFSVDLIKNVVKKVTQKLDEYNKEILRSAHKLDMTGMGKIHLFALLITWRTLCFASRKRLMEPVAKIMKAKDKWKNYFVSSVNNNSNERSASFAERVILEYYSSLKEETRANVVKPEAITYFEAQKAEFMVVSMQKTLDNRYLQSNNSTEVLDYVLGQVQFYEEHFEQSWMNHYHPLVSKLKQKFKTIITQELDLVLQSIEKLQNFFKSYHNKPLPAPLEIFEIRDAKGSLLELNQNVQIEELSQDKKKEELLQICGRAQFILFADFFNSQISHDWIYTEVGYSLKIRGLNGIFKSEIQMDFSQRAKLAKNEHEIAYLTVFLNGFKHILSQEIDKLQHEQLEWGYPNVGLDKLYQSYKNSSVGCTESCPTCGRKCDRIESDHHHGCDSGHQIRGMFGIMRGDYLSSRTCDEIQPDSEITIDKVTQMKWRDFVAQKFPTWDFTQVDKVKTHENIIKYRDCWKKNGSAFAEKFAQLYGQRVLAGSSQESESYHFILVLDGSGSMSGGKWQSATKGASGFLSKLKGYKDSVSEIAISTIVFHSTSKTHAAYANLEINLDKALQYPGGGTEFDAPLQDALALIESKKGENFQRHFILFYTDGGASYPSKAMTKFKNFAHKGKVTLIALCEEKDPTTLKAIVQEFKQFGDGELKSNVSPDSLVKQLPEVLNSIFHKVD